MKINPIVKAQWIKELRSGKYAQAKEYLRWDGDSFCCFGVLCDISGRGEWVHDDVEFFSTFRDIQGSLESEMPNNVVLDWAGFSELDPIVISCLSRHGILQHFSLVELNDAGFTFDQIADIIDWAL